MSGALLIFSAVMLLIAAITGTVGRSLERIAGELEAIRKNLDAPIGDGE